MVVLEVFPYQSPQVSIVEHDHLIQQFPATAPHPAFRHPILPRTPIGCSNQLAAQAFDRRRYVSVELPISVKDQVPGCAILGESLSQLLRDPLAGGMFRGIEVQDSPPAVADHEEAVQDAESRCRHREEVHRRNGFAMVLKKD
jgi:hypothetical protein